MGDNQAFRRNPKRCRPLFGGDKHPRGCLVQPSGGALMTALSTLAARAELRRNWPTWSLAAQFLVVGAATSVLAMLFVGLVVSHLIQSAITKNAGATTALYVDSVIAPILPDMRTADVLDDSVERALDETMQQSALGGSIRFFRLWSDDNRVLYTHGGGPTSTRLPDDDALRTAAGGNVVTRYHDRNVSDAPRLEVYYPLLEPWTGEVIAVAELHETAADLEHELDEARLRSWAAVALVTTTFFLILWAIVIRGSRTIDAQSVALRERVGELSNLLSRNSELNARLHRASERATAFNEQYLRRLGAELHDGPAQLIALAALRLDSPALSSGAGSKRVRDRELGAMKSNLDEALRDIRNICTGLVLPHIEAAELQEILERAVRAHEQRTDVRVALATSGASPTMAPAAKICVYRFVQEGLNNGFRHARGVGQAVRQTYEDGWLTVNVIDRGDGFDPKAAGLRNLGLIGLRERIESLGGKFDVSSSHKGTILEMTLFLESD
ncbi:sensor histidine kinase [Mesorhizobium sp. ZC-5]|uniref:sensor histidine kinase n=1 Tax=Mesorhizobium sp. ZC-5 TaxID=2986066 RepID=UPI0021E919C6|nr:sensor histidine kinase [Mesorhizobium sp. ZC-5]MCV3241780.1 sensor histidine kinase [Mesorhizobium sp. ZC-5]